jgi:hypothetical protein
MGLTLIETMKHATRVGLWAVNEGYRRSLGVVKNGAATRH